MVVRGRGRWGGKVRSSSDEDMSWLVRTGWCYIDSRWLIDWFFYLVRLDASDEASAVVCLLS